MRKAIAIGMLGTALFATGAAAQTATEQAQILGDFQRSVADYTQRHRSLEMRPEAITAATPAPKMFTLPVAMVFRQLIARAMAAPGGAAIRSTAATHHAAVMQTFLATELYDFPHVLSKALPILSAPLEYRLIGNDLVIRDAESDMIVSVLRGALGSVPLPRGGASLR